MKRGDSYFLKRGDHISLVVALLHIALVFLSLYLAAASGPGWSWILLTLWFGVGMNGILNLMHECAHYHVFKDQAGSVFLGRWILGPLVLADFDGYQKRHWDHHRHLGEDADPKYVYRVSIRGVKFLKLFLRCLFLTEAVKKFSVQSPSQPKNTVSNGWVVRALLVQGILFLSLVCAARSGAGTPGRALFNAAAAYGAVYLYGLAAITVFVASLRGIAEHQIGVDGAMTVHQAALRNFSFGFFSGFIFGAYGFKDHASHHRDAGIPYYHLGAKTLELAAGDPAYTAKAPYERTLLSLIRGS